MKKTETASKNQQISSERSYVSKFRSDIGDNSLSNNQFDYFGNNNSKLDYDIDKSISNSVGSKDKKSEKIKYNVVSDPINELSNANNVILKVEYQNCCCINESNNLYNVFTKNKSNIKYLFRAEELMPCTDYSCFEYIKTPFSLNIEHVTNLGTKINTKKFATAKKSCTIPCLCLFRPEIKVKLCDNSDILGKIVLIFSCGNTEYKIYDKNNKIKYTIDTDYCQPGILCTKNCCGYLPDVAFDILNENKDTIGTIERRPGAFEEFMRVLDVYHIFFPKNASFEDKFLLICCTFMIESEIFRDKWGSLDYCGDYNCECDEECCVDCGYRCCAEICSSFFRF